MCESHGDPEVLDGLLNSTKCNINAYDSQGYAMIHWAARYGYTACIDMLVKHGADIGIHTLVAFVFYCNTQGNKTVADVADYFGFYETRD